MTDDYKKDLLNYISGDLTTGTSTSEELFKKISDVSISEWLPFIPTTWSHFEIYGIIKSTTTDKVVFYGGYVESGGTYQNNSKGIIIITDQDLNPIKTIYEFSSGTKLRPIQCMLQEENGQFVAIDSVVIPYTTGKQEVRQALSTCEKRFIMLNDISTPTDEEFEVALKKSYIFGDSYKNFVCKDMFKNPSSSHYSFTGIKIAYVNNKYQPSASKVINLKVNVGSANEWETVESDDGFVYGGANVYFDSSDNANWKFLLAYNTGNQAVYSWEGQNATVQYVNVLYDPSYYTTIDTVQYNNQVVFTTNTKAYFVLNNQQWGNAGVLRPKYIGLFEADLSNHTVKEIKLISIGNYDYCNLYGMFLQVVNGELYIQYCDNIANNKADYYVQRFNGTWSPILVKEQGLYYFRYRRFYVSQSFNLLKYNLIPTWLSAGNWYMQQITEIYNLANYNGEPYVNYNLFKAKYGNIYSDDALVFSRNLHNLSITNNYTVATIEIPNGYLNGVNLTPKELVGETNVVLVEDGNTVSKNIYEVLYLNYINTISVKDNEEDVVRDTGRYINTNINEGTEENYNNTKCTKVCINYTDNTNKIFPIGWDSIDDTHKSTEFTIYVDKAIANIELISNDQTTTYITIERELEVGKYYTFKQYLKVE